MDKKRQIATVGALVVLACLVQAWMIWRAVAPAQDSLRYLIVAQGMQRDGLLATLDEQYEQPLFPALVWLTHAALTRTGIISTANWAICLQIAAAVPLIVAAAPVYLLLRRLHGPPAAFAGGWLFLLFTEAARLGADGLSDSTHLCLCCWALWAMVVYFTGGRFGAEKQETSLPGRRRGALWLASAGALSGLAVLARAEALALSAAFFATLVVVQFNRSWRLAWAEAAAAALSF
ncbi:MAG TPA: hypothetical protein VHC19_16910, partial [Pirellulales bacterium]|nr:hypothetical protein [Pirellulales bacterium]